MPSGSVPVLVVVMGPPGSGKTTLARGLSSELRVPCLHRDDFWMGMLASRGETGPDAAPSSRETTQAFVSAITRLLDDGVSCVVDHNFARDPQMLASLAGMSRCVVLRTHAEGSTQRFIDRIQRDPVASDPMVLRAMGATSVEDVVGDSRAGADASIELSRRFVTGLPTIEIDTENGYVSDGVPTTVNAIANQVKALVAAL
jgi:hypothetical protein